MTKLVPPRRLFAAALGATMALAASGLTWLGSTAEAVEVVSAARAALPENVRASGVLRVATSLQWPPFGYQTDAGEPDGIDIRLIRVLAEKLGVRADFENVRFPSIVPGVANGRFDIGSNSLSRTPEREQVVNFVVYFRSQLGLLVRRGTTGVDVHHLCGRTLALTQGSSQVAVAQALSEGCVKNGQQEISFLFFPNSADTYLAVSNGRGDGFLTGKANGLWIAKHNDKLYMTENTLPETSSLAGIVVGKENSRLREALILAMESAMADHSYRRILEEYGVADGALTAEEVRNPPAM